MLEKVFNFALHVPVFEPDEEVRAAKVPVVLGDLEFEDQVIAERIPREFRNQAVILMGIAAIVGKDQVGLEALLDLFEALFHRAAGVGQIGIPERMENDLALRSAREHRLGARACLIAAQATRAQHHPEDLELWSFVDEAKDSGATT